MGGRNNSKNGNGERPEEGPFSRRYLENRGYEPIYGKNQSDDENPLFMARYEVISKGFLGIGRKRRIEDRLERNASGKYDLPRKR